MSLPIHWLASGVLITGLLVTTNAPGSARAVALGEVTSHVVRRDLDLEAELRASLDQELQTIDLGPAPKSQWILSASLLRMDTNPADGSAPRRTPKPTLTCVVSATLRGARGGAMVAILEGRARVDGEDVTNPTTERRAVRAAAHAALVRLHEALR
jgi:hypothetical protein